MSLWHQTFVLFDGGTRNQLEPFVDQHLGVAHCRHLINASAALLLQKVTPISLVCRPIRLGCALSHGGRGLLGLLQCNGGAQGVCAVCFCVEGSLEASAREWCWWPRFMLALDLSFLEKSLAEAGVLAKGDCSVSPRVSSVTGVILGPLAITVPRKQAFTLRPMHQWQWGGVAKRFHLHTGFHLPPQRPNLNHHHQHREQTFPFPNCHLCHSHKN